jgi:putative PEP-CTERM system histidine kinase
VTTRFFGLLPFAAALFSLVLACVSLVRKRPSPAAWCFFAGMVLLATEALFAGLTVLAVEPADVDRWLTGAFLVKSAGPAVWLCFSLTYSRSAGAEVLSRWRVPILALGLLPLTFALGFHEGLFRVAAQDAIWRVEVGVAARVLSAFLLLGLVFALMHLEQTLRAAVGTMRWRIKFVVLGVAVMLGTQVYARSQEVLFPFYDLATAGLESAALLIGCILLTVAYARTGLAEVEVYPSRAVLRSSFTVLIVGGYLVTVGVLAQLVAYFGGVELFQFQALVVLAGVTVLSVLLLSDRARQRLNTLVARHFRQAQHDSVRVWSLFSRQLASGRDQASLCSSAVRLISETFEALTVNVWVMDEDTGRLTLTASTASVPGGPASRPEQPKSSAITVALHGEPSPFDLDAMNAPWAEEFRLLNPAVFPEGGSRMCLRLGSAEHRLGAVVLADRVGGAAYTVEELELLACIGDHLTSVLTTVRLAAEVGRARELEAFRTMSAFFVHDLKNTAASLNLMLKNLPLHFDDPAFRADTLRAIGNTAQRIDEMIARLSALRQRAEIHPVETDLNALVKEVLERTSGISDVELTTDLQPLPRISADPHLIQSVVTNLVLNARDAIGPEGRVRIRTEQQDNRILLSVTDNGCGMTEAYIRNSLFRPFQSTKKKGLGIGLFQSMAIVRAHGGSMQVESEPSRGTTFVVSLPVNDPR